MTNFGPRLTHLAAVAALVFAGFAAPSLVQSASAADVEIGRDGVDVDAGDDRYERYDETDDRYGTVEDEETDRYSDRYYRRDDEDVDIDVPGADINID